MKKEKSLRFMGSNDYAGISDMLKTKALGQHRTKGFYRARRASQRGVAATKKTHAETRKDSQRLLAGKVATKNFAKNAKFSKWAL